MIAFETCASMPALAGAPSLLAAAPEARRVPVLATLARPVLGEAPALRKRSANMQQRLQATGLHAPLGHRMDPWASEPSAQERALADDVLGSVRDRAKRRNMSDTRLGTAVGLLEDFSTAFPNRVLFMPLGGRD